jgi:hypothetical protein
MEEKEKPEKEWYLLLELVREKALCLTLCALIDDED